MYLESDSYACGAAEGLGCGLALAPALGRIDALDGVERSSVTWDGRTFRVELEPGADPERVAEAAAAALEGWAERIDAREAASAAGSMGWYDAEGTEQLSRYEASVIAERLSASVEAEVALETEAAAELHALIRTELERAFARAHAAGGGVERLYEQLPEGTQRIRERVALLLSPEQAEQVMAVLTRETGD